MNHQHSQPITVIAPPTDRAVLLDEYDTLIEALNKELVSLNVARGLAFDAERRVEIARHRCYLARLALEGREQ